MDNIPAWQSLLPGHMPIPPSLLSFRPRSIPQNFPDNIVSPIFPIFTEHPIALAAHLRQYGYACTSVPYPAVSRGEERIRVVVHAGNKLEELRELVTRMLEWAASMQAQDVQFQAQPIRSIQARL